MPSRGIYPQKVTRHLQVDVERADLGESGSDAHCRDAVKLGRQLAVLPESRHDLVLRAGPHLRQTRQKATNRQGEKNMAFVSDRPCVCSSH